MTTIFGAGGVFLLKVIFISIVSFYLLGAQQLLAATQNWDFTTSGDYTYDTSKIEVTGGVAQLKNLGGITSGATTNSAFTSNSTGWTFVPTWSQPGGVTNVGVYQSAGGNPAGHIEILLDGKKSNTIAAFYYQAFTTTVNSPDTATLNLDWMNDIYDSIYLTSYHLYAFIGTDTSNPTVGGPTQVWDSGNITGVTSWTSISPVNIASKIPTAGTYYLKIGAYAVYGSGTMTPGDQTNSFDNVVVNWSKNTTSYAVNMPSVTPVNSLTMPKTVSWNGFTETATKNGGEIYYQLSSDNGSTWKYWTGSAWGAASSSSTSNIASIVNTNISTFTTSTNQIK